MSYFLMGFQKTLFFLEKNEIELFIRCHSLNLEIISFFIYLQIII